MKHGFLPPFRFILCIFNSFLVPISFFLLGNLGNLKLTKGSTSEARARAVPGLSANGTQHLGCFAAIPARNLSSSLNGSHFLSKQPSSVLGRGVSPISSLSYTCEAAGRMNIHLWEVALILSPQPWSTCSSSWHEGQARKKPRAIPSLTSHFQPFQ